MTLFCRRGIVPSLTHFGDYFLQGFDLEITNKWSGEFLETTRLCRDNATKSYQLNDYDNLTPEQKNAL
jgi:hypothetical protein